MAARMSHVLRPPVEIHPGQPHPSSPAQLHPVRASRPEPGGSLRIAFDTLSSVRNHLNENRLESNLAD